MTKIEDAKSVWGNAIHEDHNGITVIHNEWMDAGYDNIELDHGHFYDIKVGNRKVGIDFQHGPVKANGVNGVTSEALLAIVLHRLRILNTNFPCRENSLAITNIEQGLMWLEQRTRDRLNRGVEGQNKL